MEAKAGLAMSGAATLSMSDAVDTEAGIHPTGVGEVRLGHAEPCRVRVHLGHEGGDGYPASQRARRSA